MYNKLKELEKESINIILKAYENFDIEKTGVLWSMGKDSTVLLYLIKKALGLIPFTIIHIDTGYKIPSMITFRDKYLSDNNYKNIICLNHERFDVPSIECCKELKSKPLNDVINNLNEFPKYSIKNNRKMETTQLNPFDAVFVGIRGDEESTRSKEEYFSKRDINNWEIKSDKLELWGHFNYSCSTEQHYRIHPLLRWTELDIWEYIEKENINYIDLYNAVNGERYRSIGCDRCTSKIKSNCKSVSEITFEVKNNLKNIKERDSRKQDKNDNNSLETLRKSGYM